MKTNKLLILALPLLLAISACSSSGGSNSTNPSSSSSEPMPGPSSSEEPLPEKTPEEQEADAKALFSDISRMLKNESYIARGEMENGGNNEPLVVVADGFYSLTQRPTLESEELVSPINVGYLANYKGVMRLRSSSSDVPSPRGYVLKTESLDEAKAFVEEHTLRMPFDLNKWEYVSNTTGSPVFKTSNAEAIRCFGIYLSGFETETNINTLYALLGTDGESLTISKESTLTGRTTYIDFAKMHPELYKSHHITRGDESLEYFAYRVAQTIDEWKYKDIDDDAWYWYGDFGEVHNYLPFPENGNRYYFFDRVTTNSETYYQSYQNVSVGFIDTGDLTSSYSQQLVENSWSNTPGTSEYSNGNAHVTLRFVPANECIRPDLYTKGIFYLEFRYGI